MTELSKEPKRAPGRLWTPRLALAAAALAAAFSAFAVPLEGFPAADGLPLAHPFELLALGLLACLLGALSAERHPRRALAAAGALALAVIPAKAYVSHLQAPHGLLATYRVTPIGTYKKFESDVDTHRGLAKRLDFANTGGRWAARPFPFDFVHDKVRFFWMGGRWKQYPVLEATWEGFIRLPVTPGPVELALDTSDVCGLWLAGKPVIPVGRGDEHCAAPRPVELPEGLHAIKVLYRQDAPSRTGRLSPEGRLALRWRAGRGEPWRTVPALALYPSEVSPEEVARDSRTMPLAQAVWLLGFVPLIILALGASWRLAAGCWRTTRASWALVAFLAAAVFFGWTLRLFRSPDTQYVWKKVDPFHYETEARQMLDERTLGVVSNGHEAKAAYVYYLAAVHGVFGGSLFPVIYGQHLLLLAAALATAGIARRAGGARAAAYSTALVLAGTAILNQARSLTPGTWAVALAALGLWTLLRALEGFEPKWALGAGCLLALSVYSRPNFAGVLPLALIWLAWARRGAKGRRRALLLSCLGGMACIAALFALRRLLVYGQLSNPQGLLIINLAAGNPLPPGVDLKGIEAWGWANALGLPLEVRPLVAFAAQRPLELLSLLGAKALYQVGINLRGSRYLAPGFVYELFYLNALALCGAVVLWRRGWPKEAWLPAAFVGLNMLALTATTPYLDSFRVVFPNLVFLSVFSGAALARAEEAWPLRRGRLVHAAGALAIAASLPFRYGLQYGALGLAWLSGLIEDRRRRSLALRRVIRDAAGGG